MCPSSGQRKGPDGTDAAAVCQCEVPESDLKRGHEHEAVAEVVDALTARTDVMRVVSHVGARPIPGLSSVIEIINDLESILFPGYFGPQDMSEHSLTYRLGYIATRAFENLADQIAKSYRHECKVESGTCDECRERGRVQAALFMRTLPRIREMMAEDVQAAYDRDPAAKSFAEIIFSYPCVKAITIYRVSHQLHEQGIPILPRIMTECAHAATGIDIHPGARIGRSFFIDHGTGVVIGETTIIGDHVVLYQGVTLGGRPSGLLRGKKRHPTIEDNVTVYAGATILGGDTVIGRNATIGGNVWLTRSVPPDTTVTLEKPTLRYRNDKDAPPLRTPASENAPAAK